MNLFKNLLIIYSCINYAYADNPKTISLLWDYPPSTNITFKVYISPKPGSFTNATQVISSGTNTTVRVVSAPPGIPNWYSVTANDENGLQSDPSAEISWVEPKIIMGAISGFMRFEFLRVRENSNLSYVIQFCTDLTGNIWTEELPVNPEIIPMEGDTEIYRVDIPLGLVPQLFARVKVTIR